VSHPPAAVSFPRPGRRKQKELKVLSTDKDTGDAGQAVVIIDDVDLGVHGPVLRRHACEIRKYRDHIRADWTAMGSRLSACRSMISHGSWGPWLAREFQWSETTALNFIRGYEWKARTKSSNIEDLSLPATAIYMLAAPSTPPEVQDKIIARAEAGEKIKVADVKQEIKAANSAAMSDRAEAMKAVPTVAEEKAEKPPIATDDPQATADSDDIEPGGVEEPEKILTNVLDTIKQQKAVAEAYRKILKVSPFDPAAKKRISDEIDLLIRKWRLVQSTLAAPPDNTPPDQGPAPDGVLDEVPAETVSAAEETAAPTIDLPADGSIPPFLRRAADGSAPVDPVTPPALPPTPPAPSPPTPRLPAPMPSPSPFGSLHPDLFDGYTKLNTEELEQRIDFILKATGKGIHLKQAQWKKLDRMRELVIVKRKADRAAGRVVAAGTAVHVS
jgi:Protein of unknown function (DUF3102)